MAEHPPAARRAILRRFKGGEHPVKLLEEAAAIRDPAHAAATCLALVADDRVPAGKAAQVIRDVAGLMLDVERPGRMAEAWGDALGYAASLDRGPEADAACAALAKAGVRTIIDMPNGEWLGKAIEAVAPHVSIEGARALMDRALHNTGFEVDAAAAILDHHPLIEQIKSEAPPEVAARLLGRQAQDGDAFQAALDAAWAVGNMAPRREALRVLIWRLEDPAQLERVAKDAKGRGGVDAVMVWIMVAARMDRIGAPADGAFARAASGVMDLDGRDAVKAHKKLAQAMEKAGLEAPPAPVVDVEDSPAGPAGSAPSPAIPVKPTGRHVLALVDGYTGGLGAPHVRAVARAAPLCIAFNLDLVLVGFPTEKIVELVKLVEAESNVGEGEGYAKQLLRDDRIHLLPLHKGVPDFWPGHPVATTPHPAPGKSSALEAPGPLCLLIGLGKQGVPKRILNVVERHHELTGQGISMETATAMGILADRLGRVPLKYP